MISFITLIYKKKLIVKVLKMYCKYINTLKNKKLQKLTKICFTTQKKLKKYA